MKLWKMQKLTTGKTKSRLTVTRIGEGRVADYKGGTRGRSEHRLRSVNTRVAHPGLHSLSKPTELHVGKNGLHLMLTTQQQNPPIRPLEDSKMKCGL